jgi:hypothetical protein
MAVVKELNGMITGVVDRRRYENKQPMKNIFLLD